MAVSSVRVTEGSGPYLHTWQRSVSSVNREEQYVQLGEPALPTFSCLAVNISAATSASHVLQIMAGSSTYIRLHYIALVQDTAAGSTGVTPIAIVRLSTAGTGGTALGETPFDTADTANAAAMTLPSSKGTEGAYVFMRPMVLTATTPSTVAWEWRASSRGKPIIIPSGTSNGLAVRITTGVASAALTVYAEWTETAWL